MKPSRIEVKFFVEDEQTVELPAVVPIFHRWIQNHTVEGLLIDVADYKHVPNGPGVILIGHEGDYALDIGNGRSGLLYRRKRNWESDDPQERLRTVLRLALQACRALAEDGRFSFRTDELTLTFPDRLHTPNRPETFAALRPALETVLTDLYGGAEVVLEQGEEDEKRPFTVHAHIPDAPRQLSVISGQLSVG